MVQSIRTYFRTTNTPIRFQETFLDAVHMWFSSIDDIEWPQWRGPSSLVTSQRNIGWKQMFRGFLSKQWRTFLTTSFKTEQLEHWCSVNQSNSVADNPIIGPLLGTRNLTMTILSPLRIHRIVLHALPRQYSYHQASTWHN